MSPLPTPWQRQRQRKCRSHSGNTSDGADLLEVANWRWSSNAGGLERSRLALRRCLKFPFRRQALRRLPRLGMLRHRIMGCTTDCNMQSILEGWACAVQLLLAGPSDFRTDASLPPTV